MRYHYVDARALSTLTKNGSVRFFCCLQSILTPSDHLFVVFAVQCCGGRVCAGRPHAALYGSVIAARAYALVMQHVWKDGSLCTSVLSFLWFNVRVCVRMCVFMCVYVCVCVCVLTRTQRYSGDTRPCPLLIEEGRDATVVIHEATFDVRFALCVISDLLTWFSCGGYSLYCYFFCFCVGL